MTDSPILLARSGGIATLTLNRPDAANALNAAMMQELLRLSSEVANDDAVRCVIIIGAGRLFCGGGDINRFGAAIAGEGLPAGGLAEVMHQGFANLMRMRKPLICLVNGPAAGAGMSLALSGDIVIAARTAHFTTAYAGIGLTPDGGMSWLLPRLVGMRTAQRMILANERVSAEDALTHGLVTEVVDDAALAEAGARWAERLAAMPVAALGAARRLLLDSFDASYETHLEREAKGINAAAQGDEFREGVAAFLQKRPANFAGNFASKGEK